MLGVRRFLTGPPHHPAQLFRWNLGGSPLLIEGSPLLIEGSQGGRPKNAFFGNNCPRAVVSLSPPTPLTMLTFPDGSLHSPCYWGWLGGWRWWWVSGETLREQDPACEMPKAAKAMPKLQNAKTAKCQKLQNAKSCKIRKGFDPLSQKRRPT